MSSNFLNATFVDLRINLLQTLMKPSWGIELTRWGPSQGTNIFFNTTILICKMDRMAITNLSLHAFREVAKTMSNIPLTCPLPAGHYFIRFNMDGLRRIFPARILFQENTFITTIYRFYEKIQTA